MTRQEGARVIAGMSMVWVGLALGGSLITTWASADPSRLFVVATCLYSLVAGALVPGRRRVAALMVVAIALAVPLVILLGPVVFGRHVLIHPDPLSESVHPAWVAIVVGVPLLSAAVVVGQWSSFDRTIGSVGLAAAVAPIAIVGGVAAGMPEPRHADVVGVVVSEERDGEVWRYRLATGSIVVIDHDVSEELASFPGSERALLIAGTDAGEPWHVFAPEGSESFGGSTVTCHQLHSHGFDQGTKILLDIGLVIRKAADFQAGNFPRNGRYQEGDLRSGDTPFCIAPTGEATAYLSTTYFSCDLADLEPSFCGP